MKKKTKKKYKSKGNDDDLRALYLKLNKKFFSNRLPKDLPVYFCDKLTDNLGTTAISTQTFRPLYMKITKRIAFSFRLCYSTVLHEMVHVMRPEKRGHRRWFDREMLRLVKRGAMNGQW